MIYIFSFEARGATNRPPKSKSLEIDIGSDIKPLRVKGWKLIKYLKTD